MPRLLVLGLLALGLFLGGLASAPAAESGEDATQTSTSLPEPKNPALRQRERQALITFYEALGGPDWNPA